MFLNAIKGVGKKIVLSAKFSHLIEDLNFGKKSIIVREIRPTLLKGFFAKGACLGAFEANSWMTRLVQANIVIHPP